MTPNKTRWPLPTRYCRRSQRDRKATLAFTRIFVMPDPNLLYGRLLTVKADKRLAQAYVQDRNYLHPVYPTHLSHILGFG